MMQHSLPGAENRLRPGAWFRAIRRGAAFALACLGACLAIQCSLPFPNIAPLGAKHRYFTAHREDFDTLFIGSSRVYHQIIPSQFDAAVREESGFPMHSFNFAADALWPPESYFLLRNILSLHPRRLRWVVIEVMDVNPAIEARNRGSRRSEYWHDIPHTLMALGTLSQLPSAERLPMAFLHLKLLLAHTTSSGAGAEALALATKARWPEQAAPPETVADGGYKAQDEGFIAGAAWQTVLCYLMKYAHDLESLRAAPGVEVNGDFATHLRRIEEVVKSAGATPLFLVTPAVDLGGKYDRLPDGMTVFSYADPNLYPVLYDPALHRDRWHLNEKGAVVFTAAVARSFSQYLSTHGPEGLRR